MKSLKRTGPRTKTVKYDPPYQTFSWKGDRLDLLDQRLLPNQERYFECRTGADVVEAIRQMVIRGAPAIGIAAAYGCVLEALRIEQDEVGAFQRALERFSRQMEEARPTAVNLRWALERMRAVGLRSGWKRVPDIRKALAREARRIHAEDLEANWRMGQAGSRLVPRRSKILTYCNAGTLATGGYGTAAGVIRACWRRAQTVEVFACETRPFLQGARLTAWELMREGIPVTLITDNMAGYLMGAGRIDCVIVGADRIAANGDVANKIGTYGLSVLARKHKIPFYVAAPVSTIDFACPSGREIPIEIRDAGEVTHMAGVAIAPQGCRALNPAFDVTPHGLISAIVTEGGVIRPPYRTRLRKLKK
ncbi:MAG: S-methyl-5-thioribose-1-phosphate isomerase [bacterium]